MIYNWGYECIIQAIAEDDSPGSLARRGAGRAVVDQLKAGVGSSSGAGAARCEADGVGRAACGGGDAQGQGARSIACDEGCGLPFRQPVVCRPEVQLAARPVLPG